MRPAGAWAPASLSFELDLGEARRLDGGLAKGILAYGYLPLMALRNCPIQAAKGCRACRGYESLIDRKGVAFTVDCGAHDGRRREVSDLYNSVPLWLRTGRRSSGGLTLSPSTSHVKLRGSANGWPPPTPVSPVPISRRPAPGGSTTGRCCERLPLDTICRPPLPLGRRDFGVFIQE